MKHALTGCAVLAIALGGLVAPDARASSQRITHTVTSDALAMHTQGARQVLDWVAQRVKPTFAPQGYGNVQVERRAFSVGRASARSDGSIPGKLPEQGIPGEICRVENLLPDGSLQTWEFTWVEPSSGHGGGWDVTGYTYKKGNDPVNQQ
ncbi:hypothetical protein STRNTR1_3778 [Stenotrophomonas maltophilia]|nr:hypothetical protein [Stenotrophomonas maltophilia]KMU61308.1 hypothetical protein STRNTR1_3778 [Stenotrophomonas maltophilia]